LALLSLSGGTAIGRGGTKVGAADGVDAIIDFNGTNFFASGALGTVRSEPSTSFTPQNKWIGCWIDTVGGFSMLTCAASSDNASSVNLHDLRCISTDPAMIMTVAAMNADSMITFETPTSNSAGDGECVHLKVENISKYNAKAP